MVNSGAIASTMNFDMLQNHVVPMSGWRLKWRFTEDKHDNLPDLHLSQIMPLDEQAANFLWDVTTVGIQDDSSYGLNYFQRVEDISIKDWQDDKPVKKWLFERGVPFQETVYLSWQPDTAAITNWKIFVKYWSAFYYPISDDLTIVDKSFSWNLLFYHEEHIFFGSNRVRDAKPELDKAGK